MEDDECRLRIDRGPALDLPREMKLSARFFPLGSVKKAHASEVECHPARQLQEHGVVQIFLCVLQNPQRFASLNHKHMIRQLFRQQHAAVLAAA